MDLVVELERLVDHLNRRGLEFALCGGMAVNVLGVVRATRDIDLLVQRQSVDPIREVAGALGFVLRSGRIPFGVGTPAEREVWRVSKAEGAQLLSLDLLVVTPVLEPVWAGRQTVEWRQRRLGIVSADGLRLMKQLAGRPQDLADLAALGLDGPKP